MADKLTKQQDALATRLRDAGILGDFAVLVASRADYYKTVGVEWAAHDALFWAEQEESFDFWESFSQAWQDECIARGIK